MMGGSHGNEIVITDFTNSRERQRHKRLRPTGRRDELDFKSLRGVDLDDRAQVTLAQAVGRHVFVEDHDVEYVNGHRSLHG
jgi:hypothetical protein